MSSIPICRECVTNVELRRDTAVCRFGNQTKLSCPVFLDLVSLLVTRSPPCCHGKCGGHRNLDYQPCRFRPETFSLSRAHWIREPTQTGQTKSVLRFGRSQPRRPRHCCGVSALRQYFYRLTQSADRADGLTLYEILRIPASAGRSRSSCHISVWWIWLPSGCGRALS